MAKAKSTTKKVSKKTASSAQEKAQAIVEKLLQMLGLDAGVQLSVDENGIAVVLETQDTGIVIGYHGEVLESLQLIFALSIAKELGEFQRVTLEVGDYRKNRSEYLENLARDTKEKVLSENREIALSDLKSWERRIVHMALANDDQVVSESIGEGKNRVLLIKPKQ